MEGDMTKKHLSKRLHKTARGEKPWAQMTKEERTVARREYHRMTWSAPNDVKAKLLALCADETVNA